MIGKKLSYKFKIVAAVLAVVVVASAAIALNALVANSDGSQSGLYAAGDTNNGSIAKTINGVTIRSENGTYWSDKSGERPLIGEYDLRYSPSGAYEDTIVSTIAVNVEGSDLEIISVDVQGTTFYSNAQIEDGINISDNYLTISLTKAGNYTATVTLRDGSQAKFYAQVGRSKLSDVEFVPSLDMPVYDGDSIKGTVDCPGLAVFTDVLQIDSVVGKDCEGDDIDDEDIKIITDGETGDFTVVNAGVYSAVVSIREDARDNYEWASSKDKSRATGFTVEQAPIKGVFNSNQGDENFQFEYIPDMTKASFTEHYDFEFVPTALNSKVSTNCKVEFEFYKSNRPDYDPPFGGVVTNFSVGRVYVHATAIVSNSEDGSDKDYRNYRFAEIRDVGVEGYDIDEDKVYELQGATEIRITELAISDPSLTMDYFDSHPELCGIIFWIEPTASAVYQGFDFQLWQFFVAETWNASYENLGYAQGAYWIVSVNGQEVDVATYVMRNAGTYNVSIVPKNNFIFDERGTEPFEFKLVISPYTLLPLAVTWKDDNFVYSGEEITFGEDNYTVNAFGGDEVGFVLELDTEGRAAIYVKDEDGKDTDIVDHYEPIIYAGTYRVFIVGLTGKDSGNYTLPEQSDLKNFPNGYGFGHQFVVNRKTLDDFSGTTAINGTFNGDNQSFEQEFINAMIEMGFIIYNAADDSLIPVFSQNGSITCVDSNGNPVSNHGGVYPFTSSLSFRATSAGYYSLTFEIAIAFRNQYCFYGEDPAPVTNSSYHYYYEWKNFAVIEPAEIDPSLDKSTFSIDDEYDDNLIKGKDGTIGGTTVVYSIGYGKVGTSDVKLTQREVDFDSATEKFKEGSYYILYTLTDDAASSCHFAAPSGNANYEISDDGKQAKVYYTVSSNVASVNYRVDSYVFGDNLVSGGKQLSDVVKFISSNMEGKIAETTIKFYSDEQRQTEVAVGSLVNGLPRNAGVYYVYIEVSFTEEGIAPWTSDNSDTYKLTVNKRPVNVSWAVDGNSQSSLPYDGSAHAVTAVNVNTVAGVTNVALTFSGQASVKDAKPYNYTVTAIDGDEKDNYTLEGGENVSFTLTVTAKQVTITAPTIESITFGEKLDASLLVPNGLDAFLSGDYDNEISIYVYASNGERVTDFSKTLNKGSYTLVPVWNDNAPQSVGDYTTTQGNYLITMQTATFTVVSQQLTVTLLSVSSQYGDPLKLSEAIDVTGLPEDADIFDYITLTATNASGGQLSQTAKVGAYTMRVALTNPNGDYALANPDVTATYTLERRQVTVTAKDIAAHEYGEQYSNTNYGYTITAGSILSTDTVVLIGDIRKADGGWGVAYPHSADAGNYWHIVSITGASSLNSRDITEKDGKYQYTKSSGNYTFTVIVGTFKIVPRTLTLTFADGITSEYGESINLLKQENNLSDKDSYRKFIVCSADRLIYRDTTEGIKHSLKDVVDFALVDSANNEVTLSSTAAGNYRIKATLKNGNYTIKDSVKGDNNVEYIVGGSYVVTQRELTVKITASQSSIVYGSSLAQAGSYTITAGELKSGDNLGAAVVIFNLSDEQIADISTQNVGSYYVGLVWTNNNYAVTFNKVSLAVQQRPVTITPTAVTNHVYGNALASDELKYNGANFVNDGHLTAMGITAQVYSGDTVVTDVSKLGVGPYTIKLAVTNTNGNYAVTLETANFTVVKRDIEITAQSVANHAYGSGWLDGNKLNELKYQITSALSIVNDDNLNIDLIIVDGEGNDVTADVKTLSTGDYTIKVVAANANYQIATVDAKLTIVVLEAQISFKNDLQGTYGEPILLDELRKNIRNNKLFVIKGLLDGDENQVQISIVKRGDSSVSATDTKAPVGDYEIIVTLGDNYNVEYVNWTYEQNRSGAYTITKRNATLTASDVINHTYGNALTEELTVTDSNFIDGDLPESITVKVFNGNAEVTDVTKLSVGQYVLKITDYTDNANYDITVNDGEFHVVQREITVTFVAPTEHTGSTGKYHTVYFADDKDSGIVDRTLYSSAVVTLAEGDLVNGNGDTLRSVLSLKAKNDDHDATDTHAPAGEYTIKPEVINGNYKLKNNGITGVYVIGKAQLTMTSSNPVVMGTHGYTGAAQSVFNGAVTYSSVNGSSVTVEYKVTTQECDGELNEAFFADGTTELPTVTNVGKYYIYVLAKADSNHETAKLSVSYEIVPVTFTVTAKPVDITYHDELALTNWYDHAVTTNATVTPYAGLDTDVLNTYLSKLKYETNYTTSTNAGATGIKVTPVYDNGSNGDANVTVVCVANSVTVNKANITINSVTSGHASGVYTGTAYSYFDVMSATAVNNQAITWYFSEVTGGSDSWVQYNANTHKLTDVCNKQFKVKATGPNHNDEVYGQNIAFVITQNAITIKAVDKTITYGDALSEVAFTGQLSGSDNGLLAAKVTEYLNSVTYSVSGYAVTTAAGSKLDITSAYAGDNNVAVTVVKGTLTVNKRDITISYVNDKSSIYGDTAAAVTNLYSVTLGKLVNNDKLTITVLNGANNSAYDAKAAAGTYSVTVTASNNYNVIYANGAKGTYTIDKREITVSLTTDTMDFEPTVEGTNNGLERNATPKFTNNVDEVSYDLSYAVKGGAALTGAPTNAGVYKVTVTLTDDNYTFASDLTSAEFEFTVSKLVIDVSAFAWEQHILQYEDHKSDENTVHAYNANLMEVVLFTKTLASDENNPNPIYHQDDSRVDEENYYYFKNNELWVHASGRARYEATINLTAEASVNYEFSQEGNIVIAFHIVSLSVEVTAIANGWQYTDTPTLNDFTILVNGQDPMYGLKYYIVDFIGSDSDWNDLIQLRSETGYKGISAERMEGLYSATADQIDLTNASAVAALKDSNVGRYVLYVSYDGVIQDGNDADFVHLQKYDIFEVSKKVLTAPTFESVTYNGQAQSLTVNFDSDVNGVALSDIVQASYKGNGVSNGGKISETNAGTYTIRFSIRSAYEDRYTWELGSNVSINVNWLILKDEAANDGDKYFGVEDIAATYGETINLVKPTPVAGYQGTFAWLYAEKRGSVPPAADSDWDEYMPKYVGEFWIKITLTDSINSGKNFSDKVAYATLTINKAILTLTPSGTIVYGDELKQSDCKHELSGFIDGENESNVTIKGTVTYSLKDSSVKLNANGDSGYVLVVTSTLVADNYEIKAVEGKLIVNKREVTVTIGDATSQYGLTMDLSGVVATSEDDLATDEVVDEVVKYLSIKENLSNYIVGNYGIVSSYENDNYIINYEEGTYQVTARIVTVTLDNTNAGGTYGSTINPVTVTVVDDGNKLAELVKREFTITVVYNGTAYDTSKVYTDSDDVPVYAGNGYTATAKGDASNANFTLIPPTPVSFEVFKQTLDESKIKTVPDQKVYTGEAIEANLNDEYKDLYDVLSHNDFVAVGKYFVQIQLKDAFNYMWTLSSTDIVGIAFEIVPAGIKVKPYGVITYGQTFADAVLRYELTYVDGGATVEDGVVIVDKNAIEYLVNDGRYNSAKPAAGKYALEMAKVSEGSDFVKGFSAESYTIVLEIGEFEVEKKDVELTVRNSSSIYSQLIVLTNDFDVIGLVWNEDKSVIKDYEITSDVSGWDDVGDYDVTATATADNYNISINKGTHTIKQIEVTVSFEVEDGTYIDKEAKVKAIFKAENFDGYEFPADFETKLIRKITGSKDYDSSAIPTNAGSYSVTATGIEDKNYLFVSSTSETFTVAKKTVDETSITVKNQEYNGEAQSHGISALDGVYTVSNDVYTDVDTYDVSLTLVDPDNYTWTNEVGAVVTKQFEITRATLTLTPYGSVVYGEAFSNGACGYEPKGFKGTDTVTVLSGSVTYALENEPDKLTVKNGGYTLVINADNLTARNYVIVPEKGTFTVEKRPLSIKPVDTTSVYTQDVVLSDTFELAQGTQFVLGDDKSAIKNYNVVIDTSGWINAGNYFVAATADSDNYELTMVVGQHTITPITVGVLMHAISGVYGDQANAGSIEYLSIVATNIDGTPDITDELQFVLQFSGKGYDGTPAPSSTMPTHAGLYRVKVADIYDANYAVDRTYGISETMIEIAKKAIDAREIKALSESYTGAAIRPVITDNLDVYNVYTVSYGSEHANGFVNVGSYDVKLTLNDVNNYCWKDNLNNYTTIKFEVVKADNALVDEHGNVSATAKVEINGWTIDDVASKPSVRLLNGNSDDVVFEYSTSENGSYSTEVPANAGTYWVRAVVAESSSFNAYVSAPVSFVISKRVVKMPVVVNNGASVYSGEMQSLDIMNYDDKIMSLSCDLFTKNANGTLTLSALNAGTYTAKLMLRDTTNYDWADQSQLVEGAVVVTWTIERQVVKVLTSNGRKIVVTGEDIVFIPEGFNSGIMTIRDNVRAHEGVFSAVITLKDKANYVWEGIDGDTITVEFEITGTNTVFIAIICVVAGLCVGLGAMAVILTLINRNRKRKQAADIDKRSRDDGWEE